MFKVRGCIGSDIKTTTSKAGYRCWHFDMAVNFGPRTAQETIWFSVTAGGPYAKAEIFDQLRKRDVVEVEGKLELKAYGSPKAMGNAPVPHSWTKTFRSAKASGGLRVDARILCSRCSKVTPKVPGREAPSETTEGLPV